jgi:hypothetical protein
VQNGVELSTALFTKIAEYASRPWDSEVARENFRKNARNTPKTIPY